jgi:hypothetical protein
MPLRSTKGKTVFLKGLGRQDEKKDGIEEEGD